jgi:GNAT superfamily N-acetyltransferase
MWQELFHGYALFYECPLGDSAAGKVLEWLLDTSHPQKAITAISADGDLVGFLHYCSRPRSLSGSHVGYIDDLFVVDEARGTGVADALLQRFFRLCISHGWPLAHWITAETNKRAQRLYERNGAFHDRSILYEVALDGGSPRASGGG